MPKKKKVSAVAAVAVLALNGCSAATAFATTAEDQFVDSIISEGGLPGSHDNWIELGNAVCADLAWYDARGYGVGRRDDAVMNEIMRTGWDMQTAAILVGEAEAYLCPQYSR
jgi:hypothetical protein